MLDTGQCELRAILELWMNTRRKSNNGLQTYESKVLLLGRQCLLKKLV